MKIKEKPVPDEGTSRLKNPRYVYEPNLATSALEKQIKSWAIDKLAEYHFEGKRTSEHKLAFAFWQKSGRRLINV